MLGTCHPECVNYRTHLVCLNLVVEAVAILRLYENRPKTGRDKSPFVGAGAGGSWFWNKADTSTQINFFRVEFIDVIGDLFDRIYKVAHSGRGNSYGVFFRFAFSKLTLEGRRPNSCKRL